MPLKKLIPISLIFLVLFFFPHMIFPEGLFSVLQQRVLAIFLLATMMWISDAVPAFSTSLLIIMLLVLTTTNSAPFPLREALGDDALPYTSIFNAFASPVIILFLGGFFIAMAAAKYKLDLNLARVLLKPFGTRFEIVMLGVMIITAVFSMFMSNTATSVMMLTIMTPLLAKMDSADPGSRALVISIPIAANLGGMGTPIGTPPNAIAFRYFVGEYALSFGGWMAFAVPITVILIAFSWWLLQKMYPSKSKEINITIDSQFETGLKPFIVYGTVVMTVLLWMFSSFHGINAYAVAIIPVAVFSLTGIVEKNDLKNISWDVLWLLAGGIAIGTGLATSGLAEQVVNLVPFDNYSGAMIILGISILCMVMATFMSHTATANLLMPIAVSMSISVASIADLGGLVVMGTAVALASSLGMGLPISTPPNALAHATGLVDTKDFIKTARIISPVGVLLIYVVLIALASINFF
ncbi:dihydroorotate dehydrogenase [Endozoicomonas montiporae]|uniref:Dihydroorotate dehydrogenase n=2 Tax=Endozoicomonas montiporae TaxID=1027273 RepID=A0A081MYU6_9GAMM|nr:SLC13 family permease [Endozoicomonas montiporae]AMO54831.1 sodium/di- and tricarboxylate cotransporter [Endozoicomonas montiporae CL-33]KEQ11369.1 dihydroorotate dehydrogenase [Endozoicomonas montiporae]